MQAPPEKPIATQEKDNARIGVAIRQPFPPRRSKALKIGVIGFCRDSWARIEGIEGRDREEIMKDLSMMQRHPAFMMSYRRFVVIDLEAGGSRCGGFHEGVSPHFKNQDLG